MPATTAQIIETITAAGLDYRNFNCEIAARRIAELAEWGYPDGEINTWQWIAEFPRRNHSDAARAWQLAGIPDPYAD